MTWYSFDKQECRRWYIYWLFLPSWCLFKWTPRYTDVAMWGFPLINHWTLKMISLYRRSVMDMAASSIRLNPLQKIWRSVQCNKQIGRPLRTSKLKVTQVRSNWFNEAVYELQQIEVKLIHHNTPYRCIILHINVFYFTKCLIIFLHIWNEVTVNIPIAQCNCSMKNKFNFFCGTLWMAEYCHISVCCTVYRRRGWCRAYPIIQLNHFCLCWLLWFAVEMMIAFKEWIGQFKWKCTLCLNLEIYLR